MCLCAGGSASAFGAVSLKRFAARWRYGLRRSRIAAHPVDEQREEAVGELVRVPAGLEPRVCPVRGREQDEGGDVLVQVGTELRQLPPLAEQLSDPFLVTAALGDELLAPVALEVAPLLNEDGGDVELLGDDPEVAAQRESDLLRRRQVLGDRVE